MNIEFLGVVNIIFFTGIVFLMAGYIAESRSRAKCIASHLEQVHNKIMPVLTELKVLRVENILLKNQLRKG